MKLLSLPIGQMSSNVYVLRFEKDILIVDAGAFPVSAAISSEDTVHAILCTHGHFDHFWAVEECVSAYSCRVYAHAADEDLFTSAYGLHGTVRHDHAVTSPTIPLSDGQILRSEDFFFSEPRDFTITVLHTPGHSKGSVCYFLEDHEDRESPPMLFTGDTLFDGTIGRTDFEGGSMDEMRKSLEKIKKLPPETRIFPGHGEASTLKRQIKINPYM